MTAITTPAAAMSSAEPAVLPFGDEELACLYVVVDTRSRTDVADFMAGWEPCCDLVELDWQPVRRPATTLVGVELFHRCDDEEHAETALRLVFDSTRDRAALNHLAATEILVVGSRRWGGFGNQVAVYGVDGNAVRRALADADRGLAALRVA